MNALLVKRPVKIAVFCLCLLPLLLVVWRLWHQSLGPNPIEAITHSTGDWTLRFLMATLAITPFRRTLDAPNLSRYRRMAGLYAFFYGILHLLTYIWLDKFFDFSDIVRDVRKRPFITAGTLGFLTMVPLAITSTAGWIRRLGAWRWRFLHRLVYISALAGVVHYFWLVKSDIRMPFLYAGILALLMLHRLSNWFTQAAKPGTARI